MGCRQHLAWTRAVLTDSLFSRYLADNGMEVSKSNATNDIISISFDMGTQSYKKAKERVQKIIDVEENEERLNKLYFLLGEIEANKDKFERISREKLRVDWYEHGVEIPCNGEWIKYKMLYRSTGAAKAGDCIFISERLYERAHNFLYMGVQLPEKNAKIVEMSAYVSLIASSIEATLEINPQNVLILKDYQSFFQTDVASIEINSKKECFVNYIKDYRLKNTLYDGQALIDTSVFPEWGEGYVLLRQHMFKAAAFKTNLQEFFKDYYQDRYETATVFDMFGNEHYVKDIKLVTTENSTKWLKFGISYDFWCEKVSEMGNLWGIVKTAYKSKLGQVQRMSYQMVNCLSLEHMEEVCETSTQYIWQLKTDDKIFFEYLERNKNFANDYEVLLALCAHDREFVKCDFFRKRRDEIIKKYIKKTKTGKIIQSGDNLVLCGNLYSMLLHTVGENPEQENIFTEIEDGVQCYSPRFKDGEYLAGFRSPHNGRNNLIALQNKKSALIEKYFDIGPQCLCVNCIHTPLQDRLNGCDFDSDSIYCTNQSQIVTCARWCYKNYPTIVNNIPEEKATYTNSPKDFALVDNNLARSQLAIGESSNLAQLALTYTYNFHAQKYDDCVCILSVIAQVAIDSAKRKFDIDIQKEIRRIKKDMEITEYGYPKFWLYIRKGFDRGKINYDLKCPMNYLGELRLRQRPYVPKSEILPIEDFFIKFPLSGTRRKSKRVERLIENFSLEVFRNQSFNEGEHLLLREDFDKLIEEIRRVYISKDYLGLMSWLIDRAFVITPAIKGQSGKIKRKANMNKQLLMNVLYSINPKGFLAVFNKKSGHLCDFGQKSNP